MVTENKYFSAKIVSKESSVANSSCRVYYGEAGAIPFTWESQPGTPKHKLSESSLPPLTPPPSYSTTPPSKKHTQQNTSSKAKFLGTIFPRLRSLRKMLKAHKMSSPSLSSASSSSWASYSSSISSSPSNSSSGLRNKKGRKNRRFSVSRMPLESNYEEDYYYDDHHQNSGSPTSTLGFGGKRKGNISTNFHGIRGCYSVRKIKIGCLSIVKL